MKRSLLLFVFAACAIAASAQPTFTNANSSPVPGDKYIGYGIDLTLAATPDPGPAGPNQTWSFVNWQTYPSVDTATYVSCQSTPYCDTFPSSTVAYQNSLGPNYIYYLTNSSMYETIGSFVGTHRGDCHNYISLKYPLTYNAADTIGFSTSNNFSGIYSYNLDSVTADAWGSVILPYSLGSYSNVLRVHIIMHQNDTMTHTTPVTIQNNKYEYYYFYTPGFHHPLVSFFSAVNPTTHVMELQSVRIYTGTYTPTAVTETNPEEGLQAYPNPTTDILYIKYNVGNTTDANMILTDMLGRTVAHTKSDAGIAAISTATLAPGIYLLQAQMADRLITKEIRVQR